MIGLKRCEQKRETTFTGFIPLNKILKFEKNLFLGKFEAFVVSVFVKRFFSIIPV